jgi:hypothetical protein
MKHFVRYLFRALAAGIPTVLLVLGPCAVVADVLIEPTTTQDGLDPGLEVHGQPGVYNAVPGSLRGAVLQANQTPPGETVVIRLQASANYLIERSTVWNGVHTENDPELDPSHGDMEITRSLTVEGNGATIDAQSFSRVFRITGPIAVTIKDVTFKRGGHAALGSSGALNGGGTLRITGGASVDLHHVRFEDSEISDGGSGERRGGAILVTANTDGYLRVWNGEFENCRVRSAAFHQPVAGGAIYHDSGSLLLSSNLFLRCWALQESTTSLTPTEASGGALCVDGGSVNVVFTRFKENSVRSARGLDTGVGPIVSAGHAAEGGAVKVRAATSAFNVYDSSFERNTAKGNRGGAGTGSDFGQSGGTARGGAVAIAPGAASFLPRFHRRRFDENIAFAGPGGNSALRAGTGGTAEGGALYTGRGTLDLEDTVFLGNLAVGGNGGRVSADMAGSARGGNGGRASGGAVHASHEASAVNVRGEPLQLPISADPGQDIVLTTLFEGNHAVGGIGQPGFGNTEAFGKGGPAEGGAIAVWAPAIEVVHVLGRNNTAQAGHGADGDPGRHGTAYLSDLEGNQITNGQGLPIPVTDDPPQVPGVLVAGRGGNNGDATGGFLATHDTSAILRDSALVKNQAVGGRLTGRLYHRVAAENDGVWHLQRLDPTPPFTAGTGGFGFDLQNGATDRGGDGGAGLGGAVFATGNGRLEILRSGITFNEARGCNGGPGKSLNGSLGSEGNRGGQAPGGNGGDAQGGGVHVSGQVTFQIESSSLFGNLSAAGRGGNGGHGTHFEGRENNPLGGLGSHGGDGGNAAGGALFSSVSVADAAQDASVVAVYFAQNKVAGGDGGLGGSGGQGWGSTGGHGGNGGHGGKASGGAIDVVSLRLDRSTLDRNLVSSGWGGTGGLGNAGNQFGGLGGSGGEGAPASGGGLSISATSSAGVQVHLSTISYNRVYSGFGGIGGGGGVGGLQGGSGANGGANRETRGGGVCNLAGASDLSITDSTIAGNELSAGNGGLRGLRGAHIDAFDAATVPTAYRSALPPMVSIDGLLQPGPPLREGAVAFLQQVKGFQLGTAPPGPEGEALTVPMDFIAPDAPTEAYDLPEVPSDTAEIAHWAVSAGAVTGVVGITATGAALGAIYTGLFTGSTVFAAGTAVSTTTLGGVAAGGFVTAAPLILAAGVATVWVGSIALFTVAMIETGDFEASVAFTMGSSTERFRGVNPVLMMGTTFDPDVDDGGGTIEPQFGAFGQPGFHQSPEGPGVWGGGTLQGSLVANNSAIRRARPTSETVLTVADGAGGQTSRRIVEYSETETPDDSTPNVVGSFISAGINFVGSANLWPHLGPVFPALPSDFVGVPGAELDAKIASSIAVHGGDVPTLKLLPGSPARGASTQGGSASQSQNGFTWAPGAERDIGAWGGPPNRAPVASHRNFRLIQGSGDKVVFNGRDLLADQFDPDGNDELVAYTFTERVEGDGSWLVIGFDNDPPGFANFEFTPDPGFVGYKELYRFRVTDDEFESNLGIISLQVLPPGDPNQCPEWDADQMIAISSEPTGAAAAQRVELPAEATTSHNFTGPFTVEFWMALTRSGGWAHEHEALLTKGDSAWRVARGGSTSKLSFDVTGLSPLTLRSERDVVGGWHHVAAVYDGQHKHLYINGELDASVAVSGSPALNTEPVWIGANSERLGRDFRGFMDEVRIWNHARTPGQIRDNLARTLTGFEAGLLTYYRFDESGGDTVLNGATNGSAQPGTALRLDPDTPTGRYHSSISVVSDPVLWEFGTTIVGRHAFYNRSGFDGNDPGANAADDAAIATDKQALLPGDAATAVHRLAYSRGLNGIMIDIARPRVPGALSVADFEFAQGNDSEPDSWSPAEPPLSVTVRPGAGVCGSTRVTLIWADFQKGASVPHQAVGQGWLEVTLKANERTGLLRDDTFYFGNAVGESNDPDEIVSAQDALLVLNNLKTSTGIDNPLDFNRDRIVSAQDALIVLNHIWTGFRLPDLTHGSLGDAAIEGFVASESDLLAEARRLVLQAIATLDEGGTTILGLEPSGPHQFRLTYRLPIGRQGRLFTAAAATGPWVGLDNGRLDGQPGTGVAWIRIPPDSQAGFYRIQLLPTSESE